MGEEILPGRDMVGGMGSTRNVVVGLVLLVVGVALWRALTDSGDVGREPDGTAALTRELPEEEDESSASNGPALPAQEARRESAAPVEPEFPPVVEPKVARVVERGIFGRVTDHDGEPVARHTVQLSILLAMGRQPVGSATTDLDGNYSISMELGDFARELQRSRIEVHEEWAEWSEEVTSSGDELALQILLDNQRNFSDAAWLEVSCQNFLGFWARKRIDLRPNMPAQLRVDLRVEELRDLEGQVIGSDGPVAAANVMLFDADWGLHGTALSDAEGRFQMDAPPPGPYILHARLVGVGAGQTGGTSAGGGTRAPFQTVQLMGDKRLAGWVVNPVGDPIAGLPVTAISNDLAQSSESALWPSRRELAQAESMGALAFSETLTRGDGSFTFTAMQPGDYVLRFGSVPDRFQPQSLYPTGGQHQLVFGGCLLEVLLVGEAEDTLGTRVHCVAMRSPSDLPGQTLKHYVRENSLGKNRFLLEPGRSWRVFAEKEGKIQGERQVKIGEEDYKTQETLRLQPWSETAKPHWPVDSRATASASLVLKLRGAGKRPLQGLATLSKVEAACSAMKIERVRISSQGFSGLTPGLYDLFVESVPESTPFLPVKRKGKVSLRESQTERLTLAVQAGAGLQLTAPEGSKEARGLVAYLVPEEQKGPRVSLSFAGKKRGPLLPVLPMGETAHCAPIVPAGKYTLMVKGVGGELNIPPQSLELEAGKILPVTLQLPE